MLSLPLFEDTDLFPSSHCPTQVIPSHGFHKLLIHVYRPGCFINVFSPILLRQYFWARIFYIDIPFHYHFFLSFNLYPIIINYRANALHNFCVA